MNKKLLALSTLGLLLAACNGVINPGPTGTLEGQVIAPGGFDVLSLNMSEATAAWSAPRRTGQVLVARSSTFSAQELSALSSVRTLAVDKDLTLAFTPAGQTDQAFAQSLKAQGFEVQPNYLYQALGSSTPNDEKRAQQTYLDRTKVPAAWALLADNKFNPSPIKVAVLDNGFQLDHPDLTNRFIKGAAKDFCSSLGAAANAACTGEDNDVATDAGAAGAGADTGHGTASSGIIGAQSNNTIGISGITWSGQNIIPIKVFGLTTDSRIYSADTVAVRKGIDYAVSQGVRVINLSLGLPFYKPGSLNPIDGVDANNYDPAVRTSLEAAYNANVVVVAAAGNTNNEGIYYPASEGTVIAVGGVNNSNVLFSNADVPGAGSNIGSARPTTSQTKTIDIVAPAIDILSTTDGGQYSSRPGTSEAAPQVAGVAALLIAEKPTATAREVKLALIEGATQIGNDPRSYGNGLLNAENAVIKIRAGLADPGNPGNPDPGQGQLPNRQYTVTVQALRNQVVQAQLNRILRSGESRVSYRFENLPQGNYTLKATIAKPQPATGTRVVNLNTGRVNIDICTDENGKTSCP